MARLEPQAFTRKCYHGLQLSSDGAGISTVRTRAGDVALRASVPFVSVNMGACCL